MKSVIAEVDKHDIYLLPTIRVRYYDDEIFNYKAITIEFHLIIFHLRIIYQFTTHNK